MKILKTTKAVLTICSLLFLGTGCSNENANSFNGTFKHIQFPKEQTLKGEKLAYINSIGVYGCDLVHPYLLLNLTKQEKQVGIYNVVEKKFVGDYFRFGGGPDEFVSFTIMNQNNDSLLGINDIHRKELRIINLHQTIANKRMVYKQKRRYDNPDYNYVVFQTKDSLLWFKTLTKEGKFIYRCSDSTYTDKELYTEELSANDLNHIQSLADGMKEDGSKIVTLAGVLDQIDILSLNPNDSSISVTTAEKPVTIRKLQNRQYEQAIDYYLSLPRCNDRYILALYASPKTQQKELHLIDWSGNGVSKYLVEENLIDFCIDWKRKVVYGVTQEEEVYQYSIEFP